MLNTVGRKKCGYGEDSVCFARALGVLRLQAALGLLDYSGGARPRWLRIRRQDTAPQGQRRIKMQTKTSRAAVSYTARRSGTYLANCYRVH